MKDRNFNRIIEIMKNVSEEIDEISLNVSSLTLNRCTGKIRESMKFDITWAPEFLIAKMPLECLYFILEYLDFVNAVAKVVGYQPFCKYMDGRDSFLVSEWNKQKPAKRFTELEGEKRKGFIRDLKKI